jgi:hypothetical protein
MRAAQSSATTCAGQIAVPRKTRLEPRTPQGRRLEKLRLVLGFEHQIDFVAELGCSQPRYNQYARGTRSITTEMADLIYRRFPIPGIRAWIVWGEPSGLPAEYFRLLEGRPSRPPTSS